MGVVAQGGPLLDAEPVLFVGDGQLQIGDVNAGLDDGVGTDEERHSAAIQDLL